MLVCAAMALTETPLHDAVGVEVSGLDLEDGTAPAAVETLRDCVHRHGCALLRGHPARPSGG